MNRLRTQIAILSFLTLLHTCEIGFGSTIYTSNVAPLAVLGRDDYFDELLAQLAAEQFSLREKASATIKNRRLTPDEFKRLLQSTKSKDLEQAERATLLVAEKLPEIAPSAGTLLRSIRNKNGVDISPKGGPSPNIKVLLQNPSKPEEPIPHFSPWVFDEAFAFNANIFGKPPTPTELMLAEFAKRGVSVERALLRADTTEAKTELEAWKNYLEKNVTENAWAEASFRKFDAVTGQGTNKALGRQEAIGIIQQAIELIPKINNEIEGKLEPPPGPVEAIRILIASSGSADVGRSFHLAFENLGMGGALILQPRPLETGLLWTDERVAVSEMPMFDLQATEGLKFVGNITVGFNFSDMPTDLDALRIFRVTETAVYTLTPRITLGDHVASASYTAPTDGSNQLGEFYLLAVTAVPEPPMIVLMLFGALALGLVRASHFTTGSPN